MIFIGLSILIWGGIEGYYGQIFKEEINNMPLAKKIDEAFLTLEFTFTIVFVVLILIVSIALGIFFEVLYNNLPTETSTKKSLVYLGMVWFVLGVVAFYTQGGENFHFHVFNVIGWLLYGFLLGKFYDAFSKEPDAGIFYIIKKVVLRR